MLRQTVDGFKNAQNIYENGAYSGVYAILTLEKGVPISLEKGEEISGLNTIKKQVTGKLRKDVKKGGTIIEVEYQTSDYCRVNGESISKQRCFAENGSVEADWFENIRYSYNIEQDTKNSRTIQRLSTLAKVEYNNNTAEGCFDDYMMQFKDYYGRYDYADHWIMTAFKEGTTEFENGNANFALYYKEGLSEIIQNAGALMSVWMHVVLKMGESIHNCQMLENDEKQNNNEIDIIDNDIDDENNNKESKITSPITVTAPWDESVALYFGSQENGRPNSGYFPYAYGNKVCKNFGTCGTLIFSQAQSNMEAIANFVTGQQALKDKKCEDAKNVRQIIVRQMTVPLIQGTLHSAYTVGVQMNTREEIRAEGAVLAASILPLVHACNAEDANMIYTNMKVGAETIPNFLVVKAAFENNYECLGIKCEDIGGIIDPNKRGQYSYLESAGPCGVDASTIDSADSINEESARVEKAKKLSIEVTIGLTVGAVFVAALLLGAYEYFYGVKWY